MAGWWRGEGHEERSQGTGNHQALKHTKKKRKVGEHNRCGLSFCSSELESDRRARLKQRNRKKKSGFQEFRRVLRFAGASSVSFVVFFPDCFFPNDFLSCQRLRDECDTKASHRKRKENALKGQNKTHEERGRWAGRGREKEKKREA